MAVEYISYNQTEELVKKWPIIQGIKESLTIELERLSKASKSEVDDYIVTKVAGNKFLSDLPSVGQISDTTGNIAISYQQVIEHDYINTLEAIMKEKLLIELVDDKLNVAYRRLPFVQQRIVQLFYLENKTWRDTLNALNKDKIFFNKQQAQRQRRIAIERIRSISKITVDMYKQVMELVEVE